MSVSREVRSTLWGGLQHSLGRCVKVGFEGLLKEHEFLTGEK